MRLSLAARKQAKQNTLDSWLEKKYCSPKRLEEWVASYRAEGKTIVTINGSFDLMHAGHLHILYEASKQADILLVALNSDRSIKTYKSESRPIVPLEDRLKMMMAVAFVDAVTYFDETTPMQLLEKIHPDVHVNGMDYYGNCIEEELVKDYGGRVHFVELVNGLSTTKLLNRIKKVDSERV